MQVSFHSTKEAMNCQPYNEVSQSRPHPKWWEHNLYFELKHYIYYFLFLRIIYDQRCPERLLIHKTLIEPPVLSHIKALIGSINNHRIFHQIMCFQILQQTSDFIVNRFNTPKIIFEIFLIFPFFISAPAAFFS